MQISKAGLPGQKTRRDTRVTTLIEKKEHVLIYGNGGVGKTHLAQAIGHETCRKGYEVLFVKSVKMLRGLHAARADHSLEKRIKKFLRPDLLIIDGFGLTALTAIQAEDFYEIVTESILTPR